MPPSRARRQPKCRKHGFKDRIAALMALAEIQHKDKSTRERTEQRAYYHPACHKWHLTSQTIEDRYPRR